MPTYLFRKKYQFCYRTSRSMILPNRAPYRLKWTPKTQNFAFIEVGEGYIPLTPFKYDIFATSKHWQIVRPRFAHRRKFEFCYRALLPNRALYSVKWLPKTQNFAFVQVGEGYIPLNPFKYDIFGTSKHWLFVRPRYPTTRNFEFCFRSTVLPIELHKGQNGFKNLKISHLYGHLRAVTP